MSETELKPCPFCGGAAALLHDKDIKKLCSVRCQTTGCHLELPGGNCFFSDEEQAFNEWNNRPGEEALTTAADAMADGVMQTFLSLAAPLDELDQEKMTELADDLRGLYAAYRALRGKE